MAKLIVFTRLGHDLGDGASRLFPCSSADARRFAHHIGEPVLIADITPSLAGGYIALGILRDFEIRDANGALARIDNIRTFAQDVPFQETPPDLEGISELADDLFERIAILATPAADADEAFSPYLSTVPLDAFSTQLARQQGRRCSFSDVKTHSGAATIIRPLGLGGTWHIGNFLFLDPEPGQLFARFAWTIGPKLEILIDAYAMTSDISDTINRTGMLAISDRAIASLDRAAIAWHRQQFFNRLG